MRIYENGCRGGWNGDESEKWMNVEWMDYLE